MHPHEKPVYGPALVPPTRSSGPEVEFLSRNITGQEGASTTAAVLPASPPSSPPTPPSQPFLQAKRSWPGTAWITAARAAFPARRRTAAREPLPPRDPSGNSAGCSSRAPQLNLCRPRSPLPAHPLAPPPAPPPASLHAGLQRGIVGNSRGMFFSSPLPLLCSSSISPLCGTSSFQGVTSGPARWASR